MNEVQHTCFLHQQCLLVVRNYQHARHNRQTSRHSDEYCQLFPTFEFPEQKKTHNISTLFFHYSSSKEYILEWHSLQIFCVSETYFLFLFFFYYLLLRTGYFLQYNETYIKAELTKYYIISRIASTTSNARWGLMLQMLHTMWSARHCVFVTTVSNAKMAEPTEMPFGV